MSSPPCESGNAALKKWSKRQKSDQQKAGDRDRSFRAQEEGQKGREEKDRDLQTGRIVRAVANPFTTILGHMTGRQLLRRPGYDVDVEQILMACAQYGVAVEVNANPWRLDLDWRWHPRALEIGCDFSIDPDAHSTSEIDLTHWGVVMARKGQVHASHVINCLDLPAFSGFLAKRKARLGKKRPHNVKVRTQKFPRSKCAD